MKTDQLPTLKLPQVPALGSGARQRNYGLDVIRALAISLVVFAHYATLAPACGVLGVELFFVLSGYLIGGIFYRAIQSQRYRGFTNLRTFWQRRWMRTLPNYYLFLGLAVATSFLTASPVSWRTVGLYLFFLQNLAWSPLGFYGISWSLAVEEWFYLLFPLGFSAVYWMSGKRPETKRSIFWGSIIFFAVFSLGMRLSAGESAEWASHLRMIVVDRFDALMFGVVLAVVRLESVTWWEWLRHAWPLGIIMLGVGMVIAHRAAQSIPLIPSAWLLTLIPLGGALVLPGCTRLKPPAHRLAGLVGGVSKWSYSIYLCHLPILTALMQGMHDERRGMAGKLFIRLSALVLTLAVSGILYRHLEKPMLRKR